MPVGSLSWPSGISADSHSQVPQNAERPSQLATERLDGHLTRGKSNQGVFFCASKIFSPSLDPKLSGGFLSEP